MANKQNVGKIRDIRLVKDRKTGKSRGMAFVEFYFPEAVHKAMQISQKKFMGQVIQIAPARNDRERAKKIRK